MHDHTSNEQLPTPCNGCGAPMREHFAQRGSRLVCAHCGQHEILPPGRQARAVFLRCRLRNLASAQIRVQGIALLVSDGVRHRMIMGYAKIGAMLVGINLIYGVVAFLQHPLGPRERVEAMGAQLAMVVFPLLFFGAMAVSYFGAFAYARAKIRPLLAARMPTAPGQQLTCRCCGGTLPDVRDAFLDCEYCGGQNFVTSKVADAVARGAYAQTVDYSTRADKATRGLKAASNPNIFYTLWAITMLSFAGAGKLLLNIFS